MNAWTAQYLEVDGSTLFYRVARSASDTPARAGAVSPVLLLHSLFFDGEMFDGVRSLWPESVTVYAPDHRGQGASPAGDRAPTMRQLAQDMIALIERDIGEPVNVVGSSMGGYVALEMARLRPDLVRSYVLSCCTAHAERQPERFAALEARIRSEGTQALEKALQETMFGARFMASGDPRCTLWGQTFATRGAAVADAVHGVFSRDGYESCLASITQPMLVCSGALDRAKRPDDMQYIADHIPGTQHIVFDDAGHTPPVESTQRFAEVTWEFLTINGLRAGAGTAPGSGQSNLEKRSAL